MLIVKADKMANSPMKLATYPVNESKRQSALDSLQILDTVEEERFDRLTRIAKRLFDVPVAIVSLVDRNRQWFKSCVGLSVKETARDVSFCGHAIVEDEILIVEDATLDERFSDNPFVLDDPHVRFYAGCPLKSVDGYNLGTLCLMDTSPRILTEDDITALVDLAHLAERELNAIQVATIDELTQISNRRGFSLLANKTLKLAVRQQQLMSLIFIDLNDFKPINDKFGHKVGDEALVQFASLLQHTFRDCDLLARLGGDEFVVLRTNCDKAQSEASIARLNNAVTQYNIQAGKPYELCFSEGIITVMPTTEHGIAELLNAADSLMYKVKAQKKRQRKERTPH